MPSIWEGRSLTSIITNLHRRVKALETQQQGVWANAAGVPIVVCGRIPGSNPSSYGFQFLDPSSHQPLMFFGEDGTLGAGVFFYNSAGSVSSKMDGSGTHYYDGSGNEISRFDSTGLHVYNSSGTEEVAAGLLNASPAIYGLGVLPYGGSTLQQVGGALTAGPGSLNTSSTTPTAISGTTVTVEVGPSGEALVTLCGSVEMNGAAGGGGYAYMGVSVDSGTATNWVNNQTNLASAQLTESLSASRIVTGLSVGTHTFEAAGWIGSTGVTGGTYGNVYLTVQPL